MTLKIKNVALAVVLLVGVSGQGMAPLVNFVAARAQQGREGPIDAGDNNKAQAEIVRRKLELKEEAAALKHQRKGDFDVGKLTDAKSSIVERYEAEREAIAKRYKDQLNEIKALASKKKDEKTAVKDDDSRNQKEEKKEELNNGNDKQTKALEAEQTKELDALNAKQIKELDARKAELTAISKMEAPKKDQSMVGSFFSKVGDKVGRYTSKVKTGALNVYYGTKKNYYALRGYEDDKQAAINAKAEINKTAVIEKKQRQAAKVLKRQEKLKAHEGKAQDKLDATLDRIAAKGLVTEKAVASKGKKTLGYSVLGAGAVAGVGTLIGSIVTASASGTDPNQDVATNIDVNAKASLDALNAAQSKENGALVVQSPQDATGANVPVSKDVTGSMYEAQTSVAQSTTEATKR